MGFTLARELMAPPLSSHLLPHTFFFKFEHFHILIRIPLRLLEGPVGGLEPDLDVAGPAVAAADAANIVALGTWTLFPLYAF